jgi:nitroreductase
VRDEQAVSAIFDVTSWGGALPDGRGRPKEGEKPTMFVAVLSVKELQSRFTEFDAGLAISNLTLAAYAHGVGSCILGSVNVSRLREILNIGEEYDVSTVIGFGYPTHESRVEDMKGDDVRYYLDKNDDYVVPKRKIEDTISEI